MKISNNYNIQPNFRGIFLVQNSSINKHLKKDGKLIVNPNLDMEKSNYLRLFYCAEPFNGTCEEKDDKIVFSNKDSETDNWTKYLLKKYGVEYLYSSKSPEDFPTFEDKLALFG